MNAPWGYSHVISGNYHQQETKYDFYSVAWCTIESHTAITWKWDQYKGQVCWAWMLWCICSTSPWYSRDRSAEKLGYAMMQQLRHFQIWVHILTVRRWPMRIFKMKGLEIVQQKVTGKYLESGSAIWMKLCPSWQNFIAQAILILVGTVSAVPMTFNCMALAQTCMENSHVGVFYKMSDIN